MDFYNVVELNPKVAQSENTQMKYKYPECVP